MAQYQVLARKYRPQRFCELIGQEAIVATLTGALKLQRIGHAYLFCGMRGCGKTSLARIFAKALNCSNLSQNFEPCNQCSSCLEISQGSSLEVLEIDGASNRGIDDIRNLNETAFYAPVKGKYKIYLIDEVHMLTKEAFNALLKTLEEPPETVKFFFATTEPHKIPQTILSRCQRFQLQRIPTEKLVEKLQKIAKDLDVRVEKEALYLIARHSEGSLRDAESLFDQILSYEEKSISTQTVTDILAMVPQDTFFTLDQAGKEGKLSFAFELADTLFSQSKSLTLFLDGLMGHFRNLLLAKMNPKALALQVSSEEEHLRYMSHEKFYRQEQCLDLLNDLVEVKQGAKGDISKIMLEAALLRILRSHNRLSIETIAKKLLELEKRLTQEQLQEPIEQDPVSLPFEKPLEPNSVMDIDTKLEQKEPLKETQKTIEHQKGRDDTLMRFAAVELEGSLKKIIS